MPRKHNPLRGDLPGNLTYLNKADPITAQASSPTTQTVPRAKQKVRKNHHNWPILTTKPQSTVAPQLSGWMTAGIQAARERVGNAFISTGRPQRHSGLLSPITTVLVIKRRPTPACGCVVFIDSIFTLDECFRCGRPDIRRCRASAQSRLSAVSKRAHPEVKSRTSGDRFHRAEGLYGEGEWCRACERRRTYGESCIWQLTAKHIANHLYEPVAEQCDGLRSLPGLIRQTHRKIQGSISEYSAYDTQPIR